MTAPRERGILFSAPMVRAILDGRKTQTRRVVSPRPDRPFFCFPTPYTALFATEDEAVCEDGDERRLPYGCAGDRLWVRETWDYFGGDECMYQQDPTAVIFRAYERADDVQRRWRPSIFMPRWASRITLEIAEVRVQRLQELSEDDARAEGVDCHHHAAGSDGPTYRASFQLLWDSINGKRASWDDNPWVWSLTFRRIA